MKVILKHENDQQRKYPYIGRSTKLNNTIVLFLRPGKGIFLRNDIIERVGPSYDDDDWNENDFSKYNGSVTLQND